LVRAATTHPIQSLDLNTKTMKLTVLCALFSASVQNAGAMRGLSFGRDQPSGVANILHGVEQNWLNWAMASVDCDTAEAAGCTGTGSNATGEFAKSCSTVSLAIIKTSAGDKSRMQSYMADVCGAEVLKGQLEELCLDYSQVLAQEMSEYQHDNLEGSMNMTKVCLDLFHDGYLGRYAAKEAQRLRDERAAKAAEEQRKADEAAASDAKKEADAKAGVARARLDEMANATAVADAKREEAVAAAVEAQRKAEQVAQAEELQKRLQTEAEEAEAASKAAKEKLEQHLASKSANLTEVVSASTTVSVNTTESANKTARIANSFLATPH